MFHRYLFLALFLLGCGTGTHLQKSQPKYLNTESCETKTIQGYTQTYYDDGGYSGLSPQTYWSTECQPSMTIWTVAHPQYPDETCAYGRFFTGENKKIQMKMLGFKDVVQKSDIRLSDNGFYFPLFLSQLEAQKDHDYKQEEHSIKTTANVTASLGAMGAAASAALWVTSVINKGRSRHHGDLLVGAIMMTFITAGIGAVWAVINSSHPNLNNSEIAQALNVLIQEQNQPKANYGLISMNNKGIQMFINHIQSGNGHPCPSLEEAKNLMGL